MTARPPAFVTTRAGRLCILLALAKVALLLPILRRYGWDRDELYFLAAGRHLAFGYVDFPPLTAVAARLVDGTVGPSLITLRLVCSLLAAAAAVAAGAIARELGAGVRVQVLAAAAWLATPFGLSGAVLFHPTFLDLAATALAMLAATRLLVRSEPRQWLVLGLWGGVGLEAKYTIVVPLAAFLASCALWRRDLLRQREAGAGVLIAVGLLVPNVIWQITHDWISLDFASSQHAKTASDSPPLVYAGQMLAFTGAGAVLVVLGVAWLWRRPQLRPLALTSAAPAVLFGLEQGRSYYALPAMLPALVAGCLALAERRPRRVTLAGLGIVHLAVLALALPLVVPILPVRQLVSTGTWDRSFWKDELGWRELTAQTARAWRSRTPAERAAGAIVAGNYGAAGALALYGPAAGLPAPVSGHLTFQYWHPQRMPERDVLLVGFDRGDALAHCSKATVLAVADNRWHVDNEERGRPIVWCRLRAPLGQIWQHSFATARL
jgi:4-amino-4-deoxy-L-arabinose transferase-like glycosyltransferase